MREIFDSGSWWTMIHSDVWFCCFCKFCRYTKTCRCWWALKPSIRPYLQEWWLVHLFYIPRGTMVIPCGGCTDTPTPRLWRSSRELNLRPMLWYHVRFVLTPKPTDVDEHLKTSTRPCHQEWQLVHLFYIPRGAAVIPCGGCTNTPTPRHSSGELNLRPMLWYHV